MVFLTVLSAALALTALVTRPLMPVDETRYASVAWEMWHAGEWLVPQLNGEPYGHKPPLLFWVFHAGWAVFGVHAWWPRLACAAFAIGTLWLTRSLARALWPDTQGIGDRAAWALGGTAIWAFFTTLTTFDCALAFFVVLALHGLWKGGAVPTILGGVAAGFAVLTKGPVALLPILPAAFVAWQRHGSGSAIRRAAACLGVPGIALAVALAWALPAAWDGGYAYGRAILWGQTAGRLGAAFGETHPPWWYLAALPLVLAPWSLWPPAWRIVWERIREGPPDAGERFCMAWIVPAFVVLSLAGGKRPQYLLPLLPALALLGARAGRLRPAAADRSPARGDSLGRWLRIGPAVLPAAAGVALLLPRWPGPHPPSLAFPDWAPSIPVWGGIGLLALAVGLLALPPAEHFREVRRLAIAGIAALVLVHGSAVRTAASDAYRVAPVARRIASEQAAGHPVAHVGNYEGQFHFPGRLERALEVIPQSEIGTWSAAHPDGVVISYRRRWAPPVGVSSLVSLPYKGGEVNLWRARDLPGVPEDGSGSPNGGRDLLRPGDR